MATDEQIGKMIGQILFAVVAIGVGFWLSRRDKKREEKEKELR